MFAAPVFLRWTKRTDGSLMRTARIAQRRGRITETESSAPQEECDLSIVSDTFGFLVRAAQLQSFRAFYREFRDVGLTPPSYAALAIISANPGVRQGFVASLLGFREPNMTKLVKELTSAELLMRVRRDDDKRATGLELTDKGKSFMAEMNERAIRLDDLYTSGLKKGERETLLRLLKTVIKKMPSDAGETLEFHD